MRLTVKGTEIYASTGGRAHVKGQPFIVFIHGSGQSHLSWTQQGRSFAYDGYNVVAPDFPGHGQSSGTPLASIEAQGDWIVDLMDAIGMEKAIVVGHSQGGLVALEVASRYPDRVINLAIIAAAGAIPVNEMLVKMAETDEPKAIAAMMAWGFGALGHKFDNTVPGASHIGTGTRLMSSNSKGALAADLKACNAYNKGLEAAAKIECPTLCVLAEKDKMTPLKMGVKLTDALPNTQTIIIEGAGHMLPPENPREVNDALRGFLAKHMKAA